MPTIEDESKRPTGGMWDHEIVHEAAQNVANTQRKRVCDVIERSFEQIHELERKIRSLQRDCDAARKEIEKIAEGGFEYVQSHYPELGNYKAPPQVMPF